jgi:hypothetical protein
MTPETPVRFAEACAILGISESSLRRTMRAGLIPFTDPPFGAATFDRADLLAFRAAYRRETAEPSGGNVVDLSIAIATKRVDSRRASRRAGGTR